MAIIDLSNIVFRAYIEGDVDDPPKPNAIPVNGSINLSAIKFRAKQVGDAEE